MVRLSTLLFLAVCFDPTASTNLTKVLDATEYQNHHLFPLPHTSQASTVFTNIASSATGGHCVFKWKSDSGVLANGSTSVAGDQWMPVGSVLPVGWLKFYSIGTEATAINSGSGVLYFDVEFRNRD